MGRIQADRQPDRQTPDRDQEAQPVCAIVRAEVRPDADAEFEALIRDLSHHVRADEDGCLSYVVTRVMGSRTHFAVHARFANFAAFEAHAETEHLDRLMPRLNALLAKPPSIELFLEV